MTDREIMQQALEALELLSQAPVETALDYADNAIDALRERLAQPEQEFVAWPCLIAEADFSEDTVLLKMQCTDYKVSAGTHYLSTTPPQRKPLTDKELADLWYKQSTDWMEFARAIEAAHGIKGENT